MPPFYSQDGFQEAPTATLSLKITDPITFNSSGALSVKVGGGITINQNGQLETTNATTAVNPPLEYANGAISLNTGNGLAVDSTQNLTILTSSPLAVSQSGLTLNTGDGLEVDGDEVKVKSGQGVSVGTTGVGINAASYFAFPSNVLSLLTTAPLSVSSGSLGVELGNGLQVSNDQLTLNTQPLFTFSNGAMGLAVGNGIQIENNAVAIYAQPYFQYTNRALGLRLGNGLQTENNAIALYCQPYFQYTDNALALRLGQGLQISNNQVALYAQSYFQYTNNALALRLANGLGTSNNNVVVNYGKGLFINSSDSNKLQVNIRSPLNYYGSSHTIGLNTGNGLTVTSLGALGGNVSVNIGSGLSFSSTGQVQASLGNGLQIASSAIEVKLGNGLQFDNGAISLSGSSPAYTDYTLWTTPDPSPNATISAELDAKLVLSISKAGSTAIGTIGVVGLKGPLLSLAEQAINVEIYFDTSGNIIFSTSTLKSYWGFRSGDSYDPNSTLNPLYLMPNQTAYPPGRQTITQIASLEVYLGGDTTKPVLLEVAFNTASSGYSLKFTWRNLASYAGQTFAVSLGTFTYITQQ